VFAAQDGAVEAEGVTLDESYVKASIVEGASLNPEELNAGAATPACSRTTTSSRAEGVTLRLASRVR